MPADRTDVITVRPRLGGRWLATAACCAAAWAIAQYWIEIGAHRLVLPVLLGFAALLLLVFVLPWVAWLAHRISVDGEAITVSRGVLRSSVQQVRLAEVREVSVTRSPLQRATRTGSVLVSTERGTTLLLRGVPFPRLVQQAIDERVAPARMRLASRMHWAESGAEEAR